MAVTTAHPSHRRFAMFAVPWPVLLIAWLMLAGLMALSGAYGFHGDEMYFVVAGRHPALGYVDQPPLTPLLSAASVALFGVSPTAVRLFPAIEMGLIVILVAFMAPDLGGSRRAQVLAAFTAGPIDWSRFFVGCHVVAKIDNGLGIDNSEQGKDVSVCTGLRAPWTTLWPQLRTIS